MTGALISGLTPALVRCAEGPGRLSASWLNGCRLALEEFESRLDGYASCDGTACLCLEPGTPSLLTGLSSRGRNVWDGSRKRCQRLGTLNLASGTPFANFYLGCRIGLGEEGNDGWQWMG